MPTQHFPDEFGQQIGEYRLSQTVPVILLSVAAAFGLLSLAAPDNGFGYLALILGGIGLIVLAFGYFSPQRLWLFNQGFRLRGFVKQEDVLWSEVASAEAWYSVKIRPKSLLKIVFILHSGEHVTLATGWARRSQLTTYLGRILPTFPKVKTVIRSGA